MDSVNKTLYIPLYGKAAVSRRGILLCDPKAEEIWAEAGFPLKGKAKSKWLTYYMGMRAAVFDQWLAAQMEELLELLSSMAERFGRLALLMDCYTVFAAKASKYKNPVNEVGVTQLYGVDDPRELEQGNGLLFRREHELTPAELVDKLPGGDRTFFTLLFAGGAAKKIYRLFEFGNA